MEENHEIERTSPNSARAVKSYDISPAQLNSEIRRAIHSLKRWKIESESGGKIEAVRSTRLFKFKDDVRIEISGPAPGDEKSEAVFESASRVGKSDLGQNERNLKELLEAIDQALDKSL